jgi:hypothetical protein
MSAAPGEDSSQSAASNDGVPHGDGEGRAGETRTLSCVCYTLTLLYQGCFTLLVTRLRSTSAWWPSCLQYLLHIAQHGEGTLGSRGAAVRRASADSLSTCRGSRGSDYRHRWRQLRQVDQGTQIHDTLQQERQTVKTQPCTLMYTIPPSICNMHDAQPLLSCGFEPAVL